MSIAAGEAFDECAALGLGGFSQLVAERGRPGQVGLGHAAARWAPQSGSCRASRRHRMPTTSAHGAGSARRASVLIGTAMPRRRRAESPHATSRQPPDHLARRRAGRRGTAAARPGPFQPLAAPPVLETSRPDSKGRRAALDRGQADVSGDAVQPRADRRAALEISMRPPGAQVWLCAKSSASSIEPVMRWQWAGSWRSPSSPAKSPVVPGQSSRRVGAR